jgi:hypothetical protein
MTRHPQVLVALLALAPSVGFASDLAFTLPSGGVIFISGAAQAKPKSFAPTTELHKTFSAWLSANHSGWSRYLATMPSQGVHVQAGELRFQFNNDSVIVRTKVGLFQKTIEPKAYAFLSQ